MKKIYITIMALVALAFTACDEVDNADRLTYVEPPEVSRAVLIEDFTGQYCVNCPRATEEIERLVEEYGDTTVIAVAIHSGPFSKSQGAFTPLYTAQGDEYFSHWGLSSQPVGLVDRLFSSYPFDYTDWAGGVNYEVAKKAPVSIMVDAAKQEDTDNCYAEVQVIGLDSALVKGKLQLWLVEDSIDSFQLMPNGSREEHYNHMHVFRAAINGAWGDDISVNHGQVAQKSYNFPMDAAWLPEHCAIVAFVYDEEGVQQVVKSKLKY
ncbi:MAG: Omp28 family outer membrane lipoprotein [Muribaculaceae bacterium]|nr:Omp28 family outer membrane lipoprotein [Muribaculaceae bacterium]